MADITYIYCLPPEPRPNEFSAAVEALSAKLIADFVAIAERASKDVLQHPGIADVDKQIWQAEMDHAVAAMRQRLGGVLAPFWLPLARHRQELLDGADR